MNKLLSYHMGHDTNDLFLANVALDLCLFSYSLISFSDIIYKWEIDNFL